MEPYGATGLSESERRRGSKFIELNKPVNEIFPELDKLWIIRKPNDEFLIGAGLLSDGLVVPLFLSEGDAAGTIDQLKEFGTDVQRWRVDSLGPAIKAMKESANIGAAGFQIQNVSQDESFNRKNIVLRPSWKRVLEANTIVAL